MTNAYSRHQGDFMNENPTPNDTPAANHPNNEQANQPLPVQNPPIQNQAPTPQQAPTGTPSNTLAIIGLVVSFILGLVGLIISIIALNQAKRQGRKSGIAVAGIIVGALSTLTGIIGFIGIMAFFASPKGEAFVECATTNASTIRVDGVTYRCGENFDIIRPILNPSANLESDTPKTTTSGHIDVKGTKVTLSGSTLTSACWSFTIPEGYIVSPNSTDCTTEIRAGNVNSSKGNSLTSIIIAPFTEKSGTMTPNQMLEKISSSKNATTLSKELVTIGGKNGAKAVVNDNYGLRKNLYGVLYPDHFIRSEQVVTGFTIGGPADAHIEGVIESFTFK